MSTKILAAGQDRKKALLALCLLVFAVCITYRFLHPYRQESIPTLTFQSGAPKPAEAAPKSPEATIPREVRMDLYLNPPLHSGKVVNNVFYRKKGPAQESASAAAEQGTAQPVSANPPETDKRIQVQEELSKFRWFGSMQGLGDNVLFLERGKDILLIRQGDRIDGKYLIKRITETYLIIRALSIGEDVRIELGRS